MKIVQLEIFSTDLEKQKKFYHENLGLEILSEDESSISLKIGHSTLKLSRRNESKVYHYAINIPANQIQEGLAWLKTKVDVITSENTEIQQFEDWNAEAIYFFDAEGNIGELISRKNLNNNSDEQFNSKSLLEISEIGIPTLDICHEYEVLKAASELPIYSGSFERFCAAGDEHGLFILINKSAKKEWFPTDIKAKSADFNIQFSENEAVHTFEYKDQILSAKNSLA